MTYYVLYKTKYYEPAIATNDTMFTTLGRDLDKVAEDVSKAGKDFSDLSKMVWKDTVSIGKQITNGTEIGNFVNDTAVLTRKIIRVVLKTEPTALRRIGKFGIVTSIIGIAANYLFNHSNCYPLLYLMSSGLIFASYFPPSKQSQLDVINEFTELKEESKVIEDEAISLQDVSTSDSIFSNSSSENDNVDSISSLVTDLPSLSSLEPAVDSEKPMMELAKSSPEEVIKANNVSTDKKSVDDRNSKDHDPVIAPSPSTVEALTTTLGN
jgi:hypothetical protein